MAYGVPFRLESGTMTLLLSMYQAQLPLYHREQVSMLYQFVQVRGRCDCYIYYFIPCETFPTFVVFLSSNLSGISNNAHAPSYVVV
jgi:hypothetical protein